MNTLLVLIFINLSIFHCYLSFDYVISTSSLFKIRSHASKSVRIFQLHSSDYNISQDNNFLRIKESLSKNIYELNSFIEKTMKKDATIAKENSNLSVHPVLNLKPLTFCINTLLCSCVIFGTIECKANDAPVSLLRLKKGLREISYLLQNWDEKTTYCNFGEFQRELLLPENKDKLLTAAAELGLLDYDKSATMNIKCRKDPQAVRAFVGLTDDNVTMRKADELMRKSIAMERVPENKLDEYLEAVETYSTTLSDVDTLTYEARSDYSSSETASKGEILSTVSSTDYLQQAKSSLITLRNALETIVADLNL